MFLSKEEILKKDFIFWGSGEWVEKTIKWLGKKPKYIIDINPNIQGSLQGDIKIIAPNEVDLNKYFIVITTGSYASVINTLKELKIENFCISEVLRNIYIKNEIINLDKNLLFSSPDIDKGVYLYNTKSKEYKKVYDGKSRAIAKSKNFIVIADEIKGLVVLDKNFNLIKEVELLPYSFCHGIDISEELDKIFVVNAGRDSISVFDLETFKHIKEIKISDKFDLTNEEQHHLNDIFIDYKNEILLVSMFSFSGHWRKGIYDGGILEYDLKKDKWSSFPIVSNMWMPHTPKIIDNTLYFVDSMRGDLYKTSNKVIGKFNGFIRGFDKDDKYFYIAQSSNRYFNRLSDISLNIPINCGIYVFDEVSKASFFHSLNEFENIHSVILV